MNSVPAQRDQHLETQLDRINMHEDSINELRTELAKQSHSRGLLAVIGLTLLATIVTGTVHAIQAVTRLEGLEREFSRHTELPMHPGSAQELSKLNTSVQVLQTEIRQINATTQETREEVRALQASLRRR